MRTALACACLTYPLGAGAVSLDQLDDFENGTTQGWFVGARHPAPPANVAGGGPAGFDDNYLLLTAIGGSAAGSRLATFNTGQWSGDFNGAGVTAIAMDLDNLGPSDLSLRVAFVNSTSTAISTLAISLPASSDWTSVVFPIAPGALTALSGDILSALSDTVELRLLHATALTFPGEPIVAGLGVDNIRAVPEPSSSALVGLGILAWLRSRRPRRS